MSKISLSSAFLLLFCAIGTVNASTVRPPFERPIGPAFGSYYVPADGELYCFPMHEVKHTNVWARLTDGLDGKLSVRITRGDGDQLASVEKNLLWTWDTQEHLRTTPISFFRPVSKSKVICNVVIETLAPEKGVRFGIYRPHEVPLGWKAIRPMLGRRYKKAEDYSEDLHPQRRRQLPGHVRMNGLHGAFTTFVNVTQMGETPGFDFDRDSVRWCEGRFELRRWCYGDRNTRRKPEWGYFVFDNVRERWWRICAFKKVRKDTLPTAWLFADGILVVVNGFCSNLRVYRLSEKGVENFKVPTIAIAGHMKKLARYFYRRRGEPCMASLAITNAKARGHLGLDLDLECRLSLRGGETYEMQYQITRGRLTASTTAKLDLQTQSAL